MTSEGNIHIGTAGWVFAPWRGTFFPQGLVQKKELHHASRQLTGIEINATFRGTQKPESFARWAAETPPGFCFTVKGPQVVTHIKRLKGIRPALAEFFASGPLALGNRLGPFIWQLPPNLACDLAVFGDFLAQLPQDISSYQALAGEASGSKGAPYLEANGVGTIRHAIEMRHPSFFVPEVDDLLSRHNVARVIADTADYPGRTLTADFAYCRLQGPPRPDSDRYEPADIENLADTMREWQSKGTDIFAFFVHEDKLHAPANAQALMNLLGVTSRADGD